MYVTIQVWMDLQMQLGQANCITRFVQLMISTFGFTDNVQRNISRYILHCIFVHTLHCISEYILHCISVYTLNSISVYKLHCMSVYTLHYISVYTLHCISVYTLHSISVYTGLEKVESWESKGSLHRFEKVQICRKGPGGIIVERGGIIVKGNTYSTQGRF